MKKPRPKVLITLRLPVATVRILAKLARQRKMTRTALIIRALNDAAYVVEAVEARIKAA